MVELLVTVVVVSKQNVAIIYALTDIGGSTHKR